MKDLCLSISVLAAFAWAVPDIAQAASKADRIATAEKILSGEMGGIAFTTEKCVYAFENMSTGERFGKRTEKPFNIVAVPAGSYKFKSIVCRHETKTTRSTFDTYKAHLWFEGFDVKPGEVLYPGTIKGRLSKIAPGEKGFPIYSISHAKKIEKSVKKKFPRLLDRLHRQDIHRIPDIDVLRDLIREPYRSGENIGSQMAGFQAQVNYDRYISIGIAPK